LRKRRDKKKIALGVISPPKEGQRMGVVEIRYVPVPDADLRLTRTINILLRSAARELEGSTDAQKGEKPGQDSPPEGTVGQSDGEKG